MVKSRMNSENKVQNIWKAIHKHGLNPLQILLPGKHRLKSSLFIPMIDSALHFRRHCANDYGWQNLSHNDSIISNWQYKKLHLLAKYFFSSLIKPILGDTGQTSLLCHLSFVPNSYQNSPAHLVFWHELQKHDWIM